MQTVPFIADDERWNRTNWCAVEFNILYRWHSLVPDAIGDGAGLLNAVDWRNNNPLVLAKGVEALMKFCSNHRSGKIGLLNTPAFLVDRSQPRMAVHRGSTVTLSRQARLRSLNDYRTPTACPGTPPSTNSPTTRPSAPGCKTSTPTSTTSSGTSASSPRTTPTT